METRVIRISRKINPCLKCICKKESNKYAPNGRSYGIMEEKIVKIKSNLKYVLNELKCLNKLAFAGATCMMSDAIQVKAGTIFISRTAGTDIGEKVSALFLAQTIISTTAFVVAQGITIGMNALCSQAYGAGNHKLVGTYFMRALMIASLTCFPLCSLWISVKPIVYYLTGDLMLADGAGRYTVIFCFGYPAYIFYRLAIGYLQSQNIIYPIVAIMIVGNIFNVCLQYLFVVVVPLEISGVAVAYVISTNAIALCTFIYIRMTGVHRMNITGWSISFLSGWYHFLKYGSSCVLQIFLGMIIVRIVPIVLIGFILKDTQQLALVGILNTIWFIFTCISTGYGMGATVRIGNLLGENKLSDAKKATVISIIYIIALDCFFIIGTFSLASPLSYLFTSVEDMREQIELGIRIVSFANIGPIIIVIRGILNACCLQVYATVIQFVCTYLIACPLAAIGAYYVVWRAAGYIVILSVGYDMAIVIEILVLYFYNWDKVRSLVSLNTTEMEQQSANDQLSTMNIFSHSRKIFLVFRYLTFLSFGILLFVPVSIYTQLTK